MDALGVTVAEVADTASMPRSNVSRYLHGHITNPTVDTLHRVVAGAGKAAGIELTILDLLDDARYEARLREAIRNRFGVTIESLETEQRLYAAAQ